MPEGGLFDELTRRGIGAVVFSPLAQGLLTPKYLGGTVPAGSRAANSRFLDAHALTVDYLRRIRRIQELADRAGQSIVKLALAWVLLNPAVTSAIIGASRVEQIDEALEASRLRLDDELAAELEAEGAPRGERLSG